MGDSRRDEPWPNAPPTRVVLLGASNLTRALSCVLGTARNRLQLDPGEPLDAMIACGHGRSYTITSSLLYRTLPGIRACSLWDELNDRPPARTFAMITDIGNDIMYDVPLREIVEAIECCVSRLREHDARIVLTGLPMASIRRMTRLRYRVIRKILFPSCRISFEEAIDLAERLDSAVRSVGSQSGATIVDLDGAWYGFDPIHIKWKRWPDAWRRILTPWNPAHSPSPASPSLARWLRVRTSLPRQWTLLKNELAHRQPSGRTADEIQLSMY